MRQTLLHFDQTLDSDQRRHFCTALEKEGANCRVRHRSTKPHLLFVAYDETRLGPRDLVRIAADAGRRAQVVDL